MYIKEKIKKLFQGNGFFKSVLKVGSGNLIGQAITLISTPILSRIYSDVAYGDKAIIVSTAAIIINLSTLGLNSAVMKSEDDEESKQVFTTALYMNMAVSTAVAIVCLALQNYFYLVEVSGSYGLTILLTWLYMIIHTAQSLVLIYTNRKGKYNRLFFNPIIGAVANIVLAIPLGLAGFGYEGFLITTIISQLIQAVHMVWKNNPFFKHYRWKDFTHVIKEYKDYILFQYPANFLKNIGTEYPTLFLGRNFTSGELGSFSMCLNVLKYPIGLVAAPISTVYFRTATEYHRQGKNLADFTYKIISKALLISFIPVAICCAFSEKIFIFALGAGWEMAGTIASIKAVEYVMLFCAGCISYCRVSIEKQKSNLFYSVIRLIVTVVFSGIGYAMFHSLLGTIVMITAGNTLLNIGDICLDFYYLNKKYLPKFMLISFCYIMLISMVLFAKFFCSALLVP